LYSNCIVFPVVTLNQLYFLSFFTISVIYRRIPDDEKPLALCLSWGAQKDSNNPTFALKENEDGKVEVCVQNDKIVY